MIQRRREVQGGSIISFFPHWTLTSNPLHLFIRICEIMRKTTTSSVSSILKHLSAMIHPTSLLLIIFPLLLLLQPPITSSSSSSSWDVSTASTNKYYEECSHPTPYPCGHESYNISFPFGSPGRPAYCSYPDYNLICDQGNSRLLITMSNVAYQVIHINYIERVLTVADADFSGQDCPDNFKNYTTTINYFLFNFTDTDVNLTVYTNCKPFQIPNNVYLIPCLSSSYMSWAPPDPGMADDCGGAAWVIPMREKTSLPIKGFGDALQHGFDLTWWHAQEWCDDCLNSGGACGYDRDRPFAFTCFCQDGNRSTSGKCSQGTLSPPPVRGSTSHHPWKTTLGVGVGSAALVATVCSIYCFFRYLQRRKRKHRSISTNFLIRSASSELPSKGDPEMGSTNNRTHIFSYDELHEATNGFHASQELGDGGFGTVYKGQLRCGLVVAVKRLYENNCRRVEQFMNEVDILSRLRHKNLVILYGCTSRHSRELLLVYEYVPNGTVADHLHGSLAGQGGLTWPIRMSIAIETAEALAYLHGNVPQNIIHRDVKSNNILLDESFHVKVADFGLSRLFPSDASHVSTLPQGTPGYVDPEYHQCYQLTEKSDVYSFGVVLVELISSKPAVDIGRHRHEINLASMAIAKIQNRELEQLVDPALGYQEDSETERMTTMVAELAFRCLQGESDMRPSVKEVLHELRVIQSGNSKEEYLVDDAQTTTREETRLLKNLTTTTQSSPDSITVRWESRSTTPNTSG